MVRKHVGVIKNLMKLEELEKLHNEIINKGKDLLFYCCEYEYDDVPGFRDRSYNVEYWTFDDESYIEERVNYNDYSTPFCNGSTDYSYYDETIKIDRSKFDKLDIEQQYQLIRYCLYKDVDKLYILR